MKVVLLAGGMGTRLAEETEIRPKPMVEVGGRPLLWHIMRHFSHHGLHEFHVALGYKGEVIKRYFMEYLSLTGSMTVDLRSGRVEPRGRDCEEWIVHLDDTGLHTMTGGRLRRLESQLRPHGTFMLTYGDGVSNVDIAELLRVHRRCGRLVTITAVRPPARFGGLVFDGDLVSEFTEKPQIGEGWINGGFMVMEPDVFDYLCSDETVLEKDALEHLARDGQLAAYRHESFWQCMDTVRDKRLLETLWETGQAPWRVWE